MAQYSESQKEDLKNKIRYLRVRTPNLPLVKLAENLQVGVDMVRDLMKEISEENHKLLDKKIGDEIAEFEAEIKEMATSLWEIVDKGGVLDKDKVSAIRALLEAKSRLLNIKFDAGIFTRKIGEVGVTMADLVGLLKQNAKEPQSETNSKDRESDK